MVLQQAANMRKRMDISNRTSPEVALFLDFQFMSIPFLAIVKEIRSNLLSCLFSFVSDVSPT